MVSELNQSPEGVAVVRVLATVLERLVTVNNNLVKVGPGQVTKFHALKPPSISIQHYLERIHKYASCSTECFILALIYIDRMIQRNNFHLTDLNVHRVVITGVLLAAKFFDDAYYNNAYYAKVGGVLVAEMNSLEVEFLFRINFSLHVNPDIFNKYHAELVSHAVTIPLSPTLLPRSSNYIGGPSPPNKSNLIKMKQASNLNSTVQHSHICEGPNYTINLSNRVAEVCATQITPSPPPPVEPPSTSFSSVPSRQSRAHLAGLDVKFSHPVIYQRHPALYGAPHLHQHFVDLPEIQTQQFYNNTYEPCITGPPSNLVGNGVISNPYQTDKSSVNSSIVNSCCPSSMFHREYAVRNSEIHTAVDPKLQQRVMYRTSSQLRRM